MSLLPYNPDTQDMQGGREVSIDELEAQILRQRIIFRPQWWCDGEWGRTNTSIQRIGRAFFQTQATLNSYNS